MSKDIGYWQEPIASAEGEGWKVLIYEGGRVDFGCIAGVMPPARIMRWARNVGRNDAEPIGALKDIQGVRDVSLRTGNGRR